MWLRRSTLHYGRFKPVWERLGVSSDAIFTPTMTSSNPYQKLKRDLLRQKELDEAAEPDEVLAASPELQRDYRIAVEKQQERDAIEEKRRRFLPYGVTEVEPGWGRREAAASADDSHAVLDFDSLDTHHSWDSCRAGFVFALESLLRSDTGLAPGVHEMLQFLSHRRIPFVIMSSDEGRSHHGTAALFRAGALHKDQFVRSTWPITHYAEELKQQGDAAVLMVGPPDSARETARELGITNVVTTHELRQLLPEYVPLSSHKGNTPHAPHLFPPISAVVIQSIEHCDAFADIQLITDVLVSPQGRVTGSVSPTQTVPVFFGADEFFIGASPGLCPRLGPGAFREMLSAVYESVTGEQLHVIPYGKPRRIAFVHAHDMLLHDAKRKTSRATTPQLDLVVMVGDDMAHDVLGANAMGGPWRSVLAKSGLGSAAPAVRSEIPNDAEAVWLAKSVPSQPHWEYESASRCVYDMTQHSIESWLRECPLPSLPPCPTSIHEIYRYPRW